MPKLALLLMLVMIAAGCAAEPPAPPQSQQSPPSSVVPDPPVAPEPDRPRARVPRAASGKYAVVRGSSPARRGRGPVVRYVVEVERGLPFDPRAFAAEVHRILNDVRGWARFRRVDRGPVPVRVALSSPRLTVRQCRPLHTRGRLSCWNGRRSVINALRWSRGVPHFDGDLAAYRGYLIGHEVGHGLGHRHRHCPAPGRLAPVMMQQSKSLGPCRPNPWPHPHRAEPDQRP
ncbi:DUF3152 domain-containing protein [Nonomuraea sp. SYSU D8015]|uniref:DUF3152 domain-containing protein n=1 Tax=Nonomuraea sp. SYSU D8015 TaxID=2593644 RepID=UPI001CB73667|nr:DUF3152 domain-containing protein [Nonomuraea sp. SYSU D8015]